MLIFLQFRSRNAFHIVRKCNVPNSTEMFCARLGQETSCSTHVALSNDERKN
jgi:hypothetical protein